MEKYNLPFCQKSSFKWYAITLFIFGIILFTAMAVLFPFLIPKDKFLVALIFSLCMLLLAVFFTYLLIYAGILKKFYIEMTFEYISYFVLFQRKKAYWKDIYQAQLYEFNGNTVAAVLLNKDRNKIRKRTILNNFNSLYGVPQYSFQIPLMYFDEINPDKLLRTIGEQINKDEIIEATINNETEDFEEPSNSIVKAVLASILICLIIGAVYGYTIYKLEKNYMIIPILGCFLIISVFNKYYIEKSFSLIIRLLLGLICLIQLPIAVIAAITISEKINISINLIFDITIQYFKYLFQNPMNQIAFIIAAIICFVIGILKGRVK